MSHEELVPKGEATFGTHHARAPLGFASSSMRRRQGDRERQYRPPRSLEPADALTVGLDTFFLEHHECGRVVEDIVDEELETISLICHRCDTSVLLPLA